MRRIISGLYEGIFGREQAKQLATALFRWEGKYGYSGRDLARLSNRNRWERDIEKIRRHTKAKQSSYPRGNGKSRLDIFVEAEEVIPVLISFGWEKDAIREQMGKMTDPKTDVEAQLQKANTEITVSEFIAVTGVSRPTVLKDGELFGALESKGHGATMNIEGAAALSVASGPKYHDLKVTVLEKLLDGYTLVEAFSEAWENRE